MYTPLLPFFIPLRLVPEIIHAKIFARMFNHILKGQSLRSRLNEIDGKSVTIHITDVPCKFHFYFQAGRIRAAQLHRGDVTISGNLKGFLQLATRRQDPDTLFFKRELNIEGETETGVHIKNLLDSLDYDWDAHFDAVLFPPLSTGAKEILQIARRHTPQKLRHFFTTPDY
jgi:predicted lipid carrier protein YhbT